MTRDHENAHRPLPVVLRPVADELLSSWLVRHAAYYGVTGSFFAQWLMLGTRNLSALDHRLGLPQVARLSEKLRCDPITLIAMTFVDAPGRSAELICRGRAPQICRACADRHAREGASGAVPKHWRKAWRVTCPACGAPLSDTNERPDAHETLRDTSPFGRLWPEALAGEAIIERFLRGDSSSFESSPVALMRALLVQTWRPCGANGRDPALGWRSARSFPNSTNSRGPSSAGSTTWRLQPCPSLFGPRSWQACLARSHIPPFLTPSGMRRSSGGAGRLNAYAKKPGSTLMQQEKAI
jgi:hypothetical protein